MIRIINLVLCHHLFFTFQTWNWTNLRYRSPDINSFTDHLSALWIQGQPFCGIHLSLFLSTAEAGPYTACCIPPAFKLDWQMMNDSSAHFWISLPTTRQRDLMPGSAGQPALFFFWSWNSRVADARYFASQIRFQPGSGYNLEPHSWLSFWCCSWY